MVENERIKDVINTENTPSKLHQSL